MMKKAIKLMVYQGMHNCNVWVISTVTGIHAFFGLLTFILITSEILNW